MVLHQVVSWQIHYFWLSKDITGLLFRYFSNFIPTHIEWINDTACNVSWKDETSAVNAYLSMTQSGKVKPKEDTGNIHNNNRTA